MPNPEVLVPVTALLDKVQALHSTTADCALGLYSLGHSQATITDEQVASLNTNLELAKTHLTKARVEIANLLLSEVTRRLTKED